MKRFHVREDVAPLKLDQTGSRSIEVFRRMPFHYRFSRCFAFSLWTSRTSVVPAENLSEQGPQGGRVMNNERGQKHSCGWRLSRAAAFDCTRVLKRVCMFARHPCLIHSLRACAWA